MLFVPVCMIFVTVVTAYPDFIKQIPNGDKVPNPCLSNSLWPGVGHKLTAGSGDRNPFGLAFKANNLVWDVSLCKQDSDGDGVSNGVELGDPDCTWKLNGVPKLTTGLSHPGICEPLNSTVCKEKNSWLNCPAPFSCPALDLPTTKNITLKFPRTAIPRTETTYICMGYRLPTDMKYHAIGMKPLVDNSKMLHHMLLYGCNQPLTDDVLAGPKICQMGSMSCRTLIGLWGPGIEGECHPDAFGFPIGQTGFQYALLQSHWNNPQNLMDEFDSSGMTLYYTSQLRPNDGMVLTTGQGNLIIPPRTPSIKFEGTCLRECTDKMNPKTVYVTGALLHMHLLGKSGSIEILRTRPQQSQTIVTDNSYDYNSPKQNNFEKPIEFHAGDEFKVTCVYQSLTRNTTTMFGEGTQDEMCFGFITMYPAAPNFDQCIQWMDLPQCSVTGFDIYRGCDMASFNVISVTAAKICDKNCSLACMTLLQGMTRTGCLDGQVGLFIKRFWPINDPNMGRLFTTSQYCSMSMMSSTRKPNDKPNDIGGPPAGGCQQLTSQSVSLVSLHHGFMLVMATIISLLFTK